MSFGPAKKSHQNNPSTHSTKNSHHFYDLPHNTYSHFASRSSLDTDPSYRLDILNSNIVRINQQQEALIPLIGQMDLPRMQAYIEKNEHLAREISYRNEEIDERLDGLEELVQNYGSKIHHEGSRIERTEPIERIERIDKSPRGEVRLMEKGVKKIVVKMQQNDEILASVEQGIQNMQQTIEEKLESEMDVRSTKVEKRIERNLKEFNLTVEDINKGVGVGFERLEKAVEDLYHKVDYYKGFAQENSREKLLGEIKAVVGRKFEEHFQKFREKHHKDIEGLYREFGMLRLEMDMMEEDRRDEEIKGYFQAHPEGLTPSEKKVRVNNLEQSVYIHDLDKFNKDNTQRLMYQLQEFDENLEQLKSKYYNYKTKTQGSDPSTPDAQEEWNKLLDEMEIAGETYTSLKYQIEGAKKKYFFDMRRIEEKMETVLKIRKQIRDEILASPKLGKSLTRDLQNIEEFPDRIKNLMEEINLNLDTAFNRLDIVEEKMQENHDLFFNKK